MGTDLLQFFAGSGNFLYPDRSLQKPGVPLKNPTPLQTSLSAESSNSIPVVPSEYTSPSSGEMRLGDITGPSRPESLESSSHGILSDNKLALAGMLSEVALKSPDVEFQLQKLQQAALLYQAGGDRERMIGVLKTAATIAIREGLSDSEYYIKGLIALARNDMADVKKYFGRLKSNPVAQNVLNHIRQVENQVKMARTYLMIYAVYQDWKAEGEEYYKNSVMGNITTGLHHMLGSEPPSKRYIPPMDKFFEKWAAEIQTGGHRSTPELIAALKKNDNAAVREGAKLFSTVNYGHSAGQGIKLLIEAEGIEDTDKRRQELIDITEGYIVRNGRRYAAGTAIYDMLEAPEGLSAAAQSQPGWDVFRDFFSEPAAFISGVAPFAVARHLANLSRLKLLMRLGSTSWQAQLLGRAVHLGVFAPSLVLSGDAWQSIFTSYRDVWSIKEMSRKFSDSYLVFTLAEVGMAYLPFLRQGLGGIKAFVPKGASPVPSIELGRMVMPLNRLGNVTYGLMANTTLVTALAAGRAISEGVGLSPGQDMGLFERLLHEEMVVTQIHLGMKVANRLSSGRLEAGYHKRLIEAKVAEIGRLVETMGLKPATLDFDLALRAMLRSHAEGNLMGRQLAELRQQIAKNGPPTKSSETARAFNQYFETNGIELEFGAPEVEVFIPLDAQPALGNPMTLQPAIISVTVDAVKNPLSGDAVGGLTVETVPLHAMAGLGELLKLGKAFWNHSRRGDSVQLLFLSSKKQPDTGKTKGIDAVTKTNTGGGKSMRGKRNLEIRTGDWGTLGVTHPTDLIRERRYILILPGFTGDALTHHTFINAALRDGFGILAVTPNWADSVETNISHTRKAMEEITGIAPSGQIQIIRANSFGAFLASQILDMVPDVNAAFFITPCSASQLLDVGQIEGRSITMNTSYTVTGQIDYGLIYLLHNDSIVPRLDPYFTQVFRHYDIQKGEGDHFTASDKNECNQGVLDWLLSLTRK